MKEQWRIVTLICHGLEPIQLKIKHKLSVNTRLRALAYNSTMWSVYLVLSINPVCCCPATAFIKKIIFALTSTSVTTNNAQNYCTKCYFVLYRQKTKREKTQTDQA